MEKQKINQFWNKKIKPLFSKNGFNYKVNTKQGFVRYVNLDNAATTPVFFQVLKKVENCFSTYGSVHRGAGQKSKITTDLYEKARKYLLDFAGASENNYIIFTTNTTESVNHLAELWGKNNGKVMVSDIEHSSNLLPWLKNCNIVEYRTNSDGTINLNEIKKVFENCKDIKLLAITGASNINGYRPPIYELAKLVHLNGAKIFVDVCQLIPHHKVDVLADDNIKHLDFIAFSGHKMYAPFGIGVLVGPKDFFDKSIPYQIGGEI